MSDLDDFLATTLARQVEAEQALHHSDPEPRLAMWSTQDPVTVLGAVQSASGWDELSRLFGWLGSGFSDCTAYRFELVAAGVSGNLAYTVGYEHTAVSWDGAPLDPYTLRVTHVYRREDGEWKIVHRHADSPRSISALPPTHRQSKRHRDNRDQPRGDPRTTPWRRGVESLLRHPAMEWMKGCWGVARRIQ